LEAKLSGETYNGLSFDELVRNLRADQVPLKGLPREVNREANEEQSLLNLFYGFRDQLTVGVENFMGMDEIERYVFYNVAPKLLVYGLVATSSTASVPSASPDKSVKKPARRRSKRAQG
jgi:hypothetical protein